MMIGDRYANYGQIKKTIVYISAHLKEKPSLHQIITAVNFSSFHLQRIFAEWAGVNPKKFIQYISLDYSKGLGRTA